MRQLESVNHRYETKVQQPPLLARLFPSFYFYMYFLVVVLKAAMRCKKGDYETSDWASSSIDICHDLEKIGNIITIDGLEHLENTEGPCVIIGNHMSMMETMLLPGIISPIRKATFIVKESLLHYPVFKYVMRSCNPVAVSRTNPRQDLKTVMREGMERLKNGTSIIVFPQTTRAHDFDPSQMSSIGVKLAKKAGVPVVPLALKTDAWTNGKKLKDFGAIDLSKKTFFSFGKPMNVEGKGVEEQEVINTFIATKLTAWRSDEKQLAQ